MRHEEIIQAARSREMVWVRGELSWSPGFVIGTQTFERKKGCEDVVVPTSAPQTRELFQQSTDQTRPSRRAYLVAQSVDVGRTTSWRPVFVSARHIKEMPHACDGYWHAADLIDPNERGAPCYGSREYHATT